MSSIADFLENMRQESSQSYSNSALQQLKKVLMKTAEESSKEQLEEDQAKSTVTETKIKPPQNIATFFDIWMMGVAVVIGGQYYGWNAALTQGFGTWCIAQVLMGMAYIVLILCIAEITSAIAFSGGCFGLARAVIGFYPGFIVGCLEFLEYTVYTSASVLYIGNSLCNLMNADLNYQPLIWFIFYAISLSICIKGGRYLWNFVILLGVVSLGILLIYCFGSLKYVSFEKYAPMYALNNLNNVPLDDDTSFTAVDDSQTLPFNDPRNWFIDGFGGFINTLAYSTWAYGGIESLALVASNCRDAKTAIPYGSIAAVLTLFFANVFIIFVATSMPPGIQTTMALPAFMNVGFELMFKCTSAVANGIVLPSQFAMAFGFLLPYGRLLQSMASSNLVPSFFGLKHETDIDKAMIIGSVFGYLFCIIGAYIPAIASSNALSNICILAGFLSYFAQLAGFVMLRTRYSAVERQFYSPVGIPGVIFAGIIFAFGTVSVAFFQQDDYAAFISVFVLVALLTAYYYLFAKNTQILSKEEQDTVFKLHIINYNLRMQRGIKRGNLKRKFSLGESVRDFLNKKKVFVYGENAASSGLTTGASSV